MARVREGDLGPYDPEKMLLFDYRTDHFDGTGDSDDDDSGDDDDPSSSPTFLYAMPMGGGRCFFEETSLVASPALRMSTCESRLRRRLAHHGIVVEEVEEEEYCYIPMGGGLPTAGQRIVPVGGAASMAHPATGYTVQRTMASAARLAREIRDIITVDEKEKEKEKEKRSRGVVGGDGVSDPSRESERCLNAIWPPGAIRQRNFAVFGGDFLMSQDVDGLRGFFLGFFALDQELWGGFLGHYPGLPGSGRHESWAGRLAFGLRFLARLPPDVAARLAGRIVTYSLEYGGDLAQSVTPFFGEPSGYEGRMENGEEGDVEVKEEIRGMVERGGVEF